MLTQISQEDYSRTDPIFRVIVHDYPRKFGAILLPNASNPIVLCWHSDLVQPLIVSDPQTSVTWIGVDQRIACLASQGNTLFSMGLNSNILQILFFQRCVITLCEAQAIVINPDFTLRRIIELRELPDTANLEGDKFVVTFIDGEMETFTV